MPEKPAAEKTEHPTPKRLEKAREQGRLPQSQELGSVATLFVLVGMTALLAPQLLSWVTQTMEEGMSAQTAVFADQQTFLTFANGKIVDSVAVIIPILAVLTVAAILAGVVMSGLNFAPQAVRLKFDSINPVFGFQNLINGKSMVKLLASILKLFFVGLIVWMYLSSKTEMLAELRWAWSYKILATIGEVIFGLCIRVCVALLVIAIADALYQKWKYIQDLKMTRQEVKQERKDTEGSPEVKTRIRRMQLERSMKRMLQEVPKATVVLVNPTHVAVALRYEAKTMDAPVMLAKGADLLAEKIMEIARAYGVPVIRRPELARTIYSSVEPGEQIPQSLYVAVAEVLAMLYRLRRSRR